MYDNHNSNSNSNHHHLTTNSCHHSNTQALGDMQEGRCWKVGNNQNRPKWCEMHHLGPRWVFFFFFFFFVWFYINGYFIIFIGWIYDLGKREMVRTTGRIKMGPNNVRHVAWAHRWVFSSSFILLYINGYFIVYIGCIYYICQREMVRATGRIIIGPNDVSHIIWAHRWVFFFLHIIL